MPVGQHVGGDGERHLAALTGLEHDLLKAFEFANRAAHRTYQIADVELDNLLTGNGAGVGNSDGSGQEFFLVPNVRICDIFFFLKN